MADARSAGCGLVALALLPCCSTGRPAEKSAAPRPAVTGASPDFDASARRVRTLLEQLVAADTENPPGNEARAAAIGAARLQAAGISYQVFEFAPGRQNLIARIKGNGSAKPLLLVAHTDVVPTAQMFPPRARVSLSALAARSSRRYHSSCIT